MKNLATKLTKMIIIFLEMKNPQNSTSEMWGPGGHRVWAMKWLWFPIRLVKASGSLFSYRTSSKKGPPQSSPFMRSSAVCIGGRLSSGLSK